MDSVPAEHRHAVLVTPYSGMVAQLAKPGQAIIDTLTVDKLYDLLTTCSYLVDIGNDLDAAKKVVIYNKENVVGCSSAVIHKSRVEAALAHLTPEKAHLLHMAVGLAGEAAEMLDQVLSHVLGAPLDADNVREEAGDATFYIVGLLNGIQTTLEEAQLANKAKLLGKRYASGTYSDAQAQQRADKAPGQ